MRRPSRKNMSRSIREAFQHAEKVIEQWDKFPDEFVAISATSPLVARLFSRERRRMIELLRTRGPFDSVDDLAKALDRDPTRVGRDLSPLVEAGLVRMIRRGKRKRVEPTGRPVLVH